MNLVKNRLIAGGISVCLITFSIISSGKPVQSQATGWLAPGDLSYSLIEQYVSPHNIPQANRDCMPETKFIIRPGRLATGLSELSTKYCTVRTAYGTQAVSDSYLVLPDTGVAGRIKNHIGGNIVAAPVPNSRNMIYLSGGSDGSHMYIVRNFADNMVVQNLPDGTVNFLLKPGVSGEPIKDTSGTNLSFADYRFSSNGKWMIGDVPHRGMTRVNLETGETLMFGQPFKYNIGLNPRFVSTISGNGRFAAIGEPTYEYFRIYDLSGCAQYCGQKDMLPSLRANIPGFKSFSHVRFSSDFTLRVYAGQILQSSQHTASYYRITAPGHPESGIDYLAMGDSFTSGEGAYDYKPITDSGSPFNKCHLSRASYPYILAGRTKLNESESVACSGAKMKDVYYPDESFYSLYLKQAEGRESPDKYNGEIYRDFLAGYRTQASFVEDKKPDKVTVSVSGNDIGFGSIILACLMPGTCYTSTGERLDLAHTINSKYESLSAVFQQAKYHAAAGARIYAIGYPQLAYPDGNCALNVHLDKHELLFANQVVSSLNEVIRRAADKAGIKYIDVQNAFKGYRLCETDSSEVAVNGLTAGDDKIFTGHESYHPNRFGHQLYADAIMRATRGFEESNSAPKPDSSVPTLADTANVFGVAPGAHQPRLLNFDERISPGMLVAGESSSVSASGFQPFTPTELFIRGASIHRLPGQTVDQDGNTVSSLAVPADTLPGFYTLGIEGKNISGEAISAIKTVFVSASADDIDGDGIKNNLEKCLVIGERGQDSDMDSTDDACDGQISFSAKVSSATKLTPLLNERNTNSIDIAREPAAVGTLLGTAVEADVFPEFKNLTNHLEPSPKSREGTAAIQLGHLNPLIMAFVVFPAAVMVIAMALWGLHWRKK